jgi:protein-tyrosine phosphatase
MPGPDERTGVLFICLGNICRSPLAEGVFLHKVNRRGLAHRFRVDSAGTGGWHIGEPADHRAIEVARRHGVTLPSRARQVHPRDFDVFDHLVCMDESNREDVLNLGAPAAKVRLLLEASPACGVIEVPDPYYGGRDGFDLVFSLVDVACEALLDDLLAANTP